MTFDDAQSLMSALDAILDQERQSLVEGDFDTLADLIAEKETLIDRLNGLGTVQGNGLARLHEKVTRNQALLNSAMEGIRVVAERMANLRRVRRGLETYDQSGRRKHADTATVSRVEKRA